MKKYWIICTLLLTAMAVHSQSIERQVIGAGGTSVVSGIQMDYTVGQVAVSTTVAGSVVYNQGFQQQGPSGPDGIEQVLASGNLRLWPNPTNGLVTIEWTGEPITLEVYSATGQLVAAGEVLYTGETTLSLAEYSAGVYLVKLTGPDAPGMIRVVKY